MTFLSGVDIVTLRRYNGHGIIRYQIVERRNYIFIIILHNRHYSRK